MLTEGGSKQKIAGNICSTFQSQTGFEKVYDSTVPPRRWGRGERCGRWDDLRSSAATNGTQDVIPITITPQTKPWLPLLSNANRIHRHVCSLTLFHLATGISVFWNKYFELRRKKESSFEKRWPYFSALNERLAIRTRVRLIFQKNKENGPSAYPTYFYHIIFWHVTARQK